jgi:A-kinase anchor protein 1
MTQPYLSKRLLAFFALGGVSLAVVALWLLEQQRRSTSPVRETNNPSQESNVATSIKPEESHLTTEKNDEDVTDTDTSDIEENAKSVQEEEEVAPMTVVAPLEEEEKECQKLAAVTEEAPQQLAEEADHAFLNTSHNQSPASSETSTSDVSSEHTGKSDEDILTLEEEPSFNWAEEEVRENGESHDEQSVGVENDREEYTESNDKNGIDSSILPRSVVSNELGYKNAESPSTNSTNSEGSADSGRATGGPISFSPFDANEMMPPRLPMYEFEIPNSLVGLIIGVKGKTIRELCTRADVKMLIRPHHTPAKYDTHQICTVEGKRENVNKCLSMIKLRFPPARFPDLNLQPVFPPPVATAVATNLRTEPAVLSLPVGVPCEVYVSAPVDAGHFFVQLPTHPSFSHLQRLDYYMLNVYSQVTGIPELPKPCNPGVLCAAPAYNGWFRAITLLYDEAQDEMLVRFVDYGGFARIPRADLRQIRTDFMTLPFQAIECYLAHVQPVDGTSHWSDEATNLFQSLCMSKIIQAEIVGNNKNDNIAYVELYVLGEDKKVIRIDEALLERGLAKPIDPSKVVALPTPKKSDEKVAEETNGTAETTTETKAE